MAKYCKVCGKEIHPKRVELGYATTCVSHSTAERYTGVIAADGKTDYDIHIIKDPEAAKRIAQLSNIYQKRNNELR